MKIIAKRWWWPPDRKTAQILTILANHYKSEELAEYFKENGQPFRVEK